MISTEESYRLPNFFKIPGFDVQNWRCVDLSLNVPYFLINYIYSEDDARLSMRKLVENVHDLIQICNDIKESPTAELTQIAMLTPSWLNQSDKWNMLDLVEILNAEFAEDEPPIAIFIGSDGSKLIESYSQIDLKKAKKITSVFSKFM